MCSFFKNLDNVLVVYEAFQNTRLHTQRTGEVFHLLLEEVLSLRNSTESRVSFSEFAFCFRLGK